MTEHVLLKNAQARTEPCAVLPCEMTVLLLMVPPALRSVSPNTAKNTMGATILLKPKKYWTLMGVSPPTDAGRGPHTYLGVGYAQEGQLK